MTDEELKALVAGLAIAQDRTDDRLAKTEALLAEIGAQQAENAAQKAEIGAKQAENAAQQAKNAAQQAKTDVKIDRLSDEIDRLAKMYGGVGNNLGAAAEEFYYNSLKANPVLAGVRFESVERNVPRERAGLKDEFDLLLVNGREVFVVEVKYKAHGKDLDRLLDRKAPNFRRLFPEYAGLRHRFGLATFHIHDELKKDALARGVTVLQRKGDVIETLAP